MVASYRIFFSHGGDDTYIVKNFLKPMLEASGARVFLDAGKIEYGDDFRKTILKELGICDELVVLFTRSSLGRPWVMAEIGATLIRKKRIVAIRYGATEQELHQLGVISLLGENSLLHLDSIEDYVAQLKKRVEANVNS